MDSYKKGTEIPAFQLHIHQSNVVGAPERLEHKLSFKGVHPAEFGIYIIRDSPQSGNYYLYMDAVFLSKQVYNIYLPHSFLPILGINLITRLSPSRVCKCYGREKNLKTGIAW